MSDTDLNIAAGTELYLLADIPPSTREVYLHGCGDVIELPQLPAHVEDLRLEYVVVSNIPHFTEGLKRLWIAGDVTNNSLAQWVFPSTLEYFSYVEFDGEADLRSVTAKNISVIPIQDTVDMVIFPEAIDELELREEFVELEIIPQSVTILEIPEARGVSDRGIVFPEMESLTHGGIRSALVKKIFPNLKRLGYHKSRISDTIVHPEVLELVLDRCEGDMPVRLDIPKLESLVVFGSYYRRDVHLSKNTQLGETLVELTLDRVETFPIETEWERLESVTLIDTTLELPFIRWLKTLDTNRPVVTNGVSVANINEYKSAWGFTSRRKGVLRAI